MRTRRDPCVASGAGATPPEVGDASAADTVRVLVIDDDEDFFVLVRDLLESGAGTRFEPEWASTPEAALGRMRDGAHDAYLLDFHLGRMTGLELLEEISVAELPGPVVLLTGRAASTADRDALEAGVSEYLSKDALDPVVLERTLRYAVRHYAVTSELARSEARFRALFDENPTIYFELDAEDRVRRANQFGARHTGYGPEEIADRSFTSLHAPEDEGVVSRFVDRAREHPGGVHTQEARLRCRDGGYLWVRELARVVDDAEGNRMLVVCEDISETRELSERLRHQAQHDALTNLINRREFESLLARTVESARVHDSRHALMYLDLDEFKVVNDTCGHGAGDELLRQVASLLRAGIRARDTVGRLGGDEFGILLEHCPASHAGLVAEGILKSFATFRFAWQEHRFTIGVSIGVVPFGPDTQDVQEVLEAADQACFAAKESGRNRMHLYTPSDELVGERRAQMNWVSRLQRALDEDGFVLFHQPIVALDPDDPPEGREILLRLRDDDGSLVAPGFFLPAAERYHLSARVDQWVVGKVFAWLADAESTLGEREFCSINLSGESLGDPGMLRMILSRLDESGVPPFRICFEVTETAAVSNIDSAREFMQALRSRGCRFALDDFGTGVSSFAYLRSLPVDIVKIDGLFVKDIVEDELDRSIVACIHELARRMGIVTVAEFVESEAALEHLREIGVTYAQGYHTGRPRPLDAGDLDAAASSARAGPGPTALPLTGESA